MASVDIHLDWLRYSVRWNRELTEDKNLDNAVLSLPVFKRTETEVSIGQGYNQGRKLGAGMIFWHSAKPEQGISVQLSGTDLQTVRDGYSSEIELLRGIQSKNPVITTLHSCINVHDAGARPLDIVDAQKSGVLKTRARNIGTYSSTAKVRQEWLAGDTVYIGSPKSAVQIRVYNKAAEQRTIGDWTRIEIVFRGQYAQMAYASMLAYGIGPVTRKAILKQVDLSAAWWVFAMRGGISPPMQVKRKEKNTVSWLKSVVLPALEREIDAERETNSDTLFALYAAFIDRKTPRL